MSLSYSPNTPSSAQQNPPDASLSWGQWSDNLISREESVFHNNVPLVISTSLIAAVYSYTMIDGSANNAVNRALLMALSTFLGSSVVNMLQSKGYINLFEVDNGRQARILGAAVIPLVYYYVTKRQFQLPDMQSQAIKTGVISAVLGELADPTVTDYYNSWNTPMPTTATR